MASETKVCPACGYDITGLSSLKCPECGVKIATARQQSFSDGPMWLRILLATVAAESLLLWITGVTMLFRQHGPPLMLGLWVAGFYTLALALLLLFRDQMQRHWKVLYGLFLVSFVPFLLVVGCGCMLIANWK